MFAICNLSHVPVRKDASDKSELVSQLLFGEMVEILENNEPWIKVKMVYDGYTGWIDIKQIILITDDDALKIKQLPTVMSCDLVQLAIWKENQVFPLVVGSTLPHYKDNRFSIGPFEYVFDGNVIELNSPQPEKILERAYLYLNSPYLWGGRSPFGIDCSGFTQIVFKLCGIPLLRDAAQQSEQGTTINLLEETKPGDLAFFDNEEGKITHVGIIIPGNHIIHSSGKVRIDRIDHQGIFNVDAGKYTHTLRLIKRVF